MVFSRFRYQVVFRVLLLALTLIICTFLSTRSMYMASGFVFCVLVIYQVYTLIKYVEKTRRELAQFLDFVKYEDFMDTSFTKSRGVDDELRIALANVMGNFQKVRAQREEHYQYVQTIVQHLSIGILTYDNNGKVELINTAARKILQIQQLQYIHDLKQVDEGLVNALLQAKPGERRIVAVRQNDDKLQLAIDATQFRRTGRLFTIATLQDVRNELEEKEMEAWQNLMRVLTHEIRNSIAPIASLAATADEIMNAGNERKLGESELDDVAVAVGTIHKRSQGLLRFVESFRKIYQIPKPTFEIVPVHSLFAHLQVFFRPRCEELGIRASFTVKPETLELTADPELIEQVMINLIQNTCEALQRIESPSLEVSAFQDQQGQVTISVTDNGPGISDDVQQRIFIPFFTTKPEGSGIGLSLCRQIMRLHKGTIQVNSTPNIRTAFNLRF